MLTNSSGATLTFNRDQHKYLVDGVEYVSVTTKIKSFCKPFDPDVEAANSITTAKYQGMTVEQVKKEWERVANNGIRVHESIENYFLGRQYVKSKEFDLFLRFLEEFRHWFPDFTYFIPEQRLFDTETKLAGTADMVVIDRYNRCVLIDWKTSRRLVADSEIKCKEPYDMLPDTNLTHYKLQLNYYRMMLEKWYSVKVVLKLIVVLNEVNDEPIYVAVEDIVV